MTTNGMVIGSLYKGGVGYLKLTCRRVLVIWMSWPLHCSVSRNSRVGWLLWMEEILRHLTPGSAEYCGSFVVQDPQYGCSSNPETLDPKPRYELSCRPWLQILGGSEVGLCIVVGIPMALVSIDGPS